MKFARALVACLLVCAAPRALAQTRADAVLLVNSASPRYADAERMVRPFLDNFGIPYAILDVATTSVGPEIASYAVIVIGHASLDTTGQYLDATEQANITSAVAQGSGLVNFDWDLTADGRSARYAFVRDVFGFGFRAASSSGEGVLFTSDAPGHYVSERHAAGQTIATRQALRLPDDMLPPEHWAHAYCPYLDICEPGQKAMAWQAQQPKTLPDSVIAHVIAKRIVAKKGAEQMTGKKKNGSRTLDDLAREMGWE